MGTIGKRISIRLSDELAARLEKLAKRTGRSKNLLVTKAVEEHLQEFEDIYTAEQRLLDLREGRSRTNTTEEVAEIMSHSLRG